MQDAHPTRATRSEGRIFPNGRGQDPPVAPESQIPQWRQLATRSLVSRRAPVAPAGTRTAGACSFVQDDVPESLAAFLSPVDLRVPGSLCVGVGRTEFGSLARCAHVWHML